MRFLVSWLADELGEYISRYGIEDWVEKYYLRLNLISLIEYTLFVLAVILLIGEIVS